jgi:hypothetical protein
MDSLSQVLRDVKHQQVCWFSIICVNCVSYPISKNLPLLTWQRPYLANQTLQMRFF